MRRDTIKMLEPQMEVQRSALAKTQPRWALETDCLRKT